MTASPCRSSSARPRRGGGASWAFPTFAESDLDLMASILTSTSRTPQGRDGAGPAAPHRALIAEVEAAVRSVLATQGGGPGAERRTAEGEVFAERLFAVRHAEALSALTRAVQVAPGTVVTPLARDLLKKRGVAI